ncbi:MAG: T9SS type A sorting domain-containing protein [Flavobacteriales bacterium]|nr:T9SS type A sorting domain-containing protein [Flavobacteriales bacterium]
MRKTLLLLTLFANCVQGQSWCPPGAEWTFDLGSDVGSQTGVVRVEYDGDTLINGSTAQRLRQWAHVHETGQTGYTTWPWGNLFTRSTQDVVELYDPIAQEFDTLMWFAAQPGQHWTRSTFGGVTEQRINVLGTSTVVVDGTPLRQLVVSGDPTFWFGSDTLLERIGFHTLYLRIEHTLSLDGGARSLYCYRDDALSYSTVPALECGFTVGVRTTLPEGSPTPFPNPGADHFTLNLPPGTHTVEIFDAAGRCVLVQRTNELRPVVDTRQLVPGLFLVSVRNGDGERSVVRWVKE